MVQSEFIAALDLGTSRMIAMVGKKDEHGILSVIASEKMDSGSCMRKGYVYNVGEAGTKVSQLISKMNDRLNPKIEKVYLGVGGQSLHLETYSVFRRVDGIVDDTVLLSMKKECNAYDPELYEVIEILSPEYYLDNQLISKPKGLECKKIEARYKLILGRPSIKNNLRTGVEQKARLKIAGYFTIPVASAEAVLVEREKELGCALVEFGAGVTYVSVYKNSFLKHLVAIPLGGYVITKDISTMNVLENEAEALKVNWGSALVELDDQVKIEDYPQIKINDLNDVIEARLDEIFANVLEQIKVSGFGDVLGAGIVITGGGSNLNKIADALRKKSGKEVRLAAVKKSLVNQAVDWANDNSNSAIVGILSLGKENCAASAPVISKDGQISIPGGDFGTIKPEVTESNNNRTTAGSKNHTLEEDKKNNISSTDNRSAGTGNPGNRGKIMKNWKKKFENMSKSLFDDEFSKETTDNQKANDE
ncbi:MAG: cell division protein FtsA [Dysgonamonadaceae bacterium]|jgi:cell division protein FtsA|nr:cell division protein FtsA [Dysgonamonadaceae bacterium]